MKTKTPKSPLQRLQIEGKVNLRELTRSVVTGRQSAVAKAVGVRPATISDYLSGKSAMSSDNVEKILNWKE